MFTDYAIDVISDSGSFDWFFLLGYGSHLEFLYKSSNFLLDASYWANQIV